MAKANLVLPNGTTVTIDGSADEVALLLAKFSSNGVSPGSTKNSRSPRKRASRGARGGGSVKKADGPTSLIGELAAADFFKSKRTMSDIQRKLEEMGHIYATGSISPILTRLTRRRVIRRIKEDKGWVYVK